MTITSKLFMVSVLALIVATPAVAAQLPATEGDYYAPTNTVVQQATSQELSQAHEGDYYAPTNGGQVNAKRAAAIQTCTQQANAQYGDSGDVNWRRFNHDAYAACMANKGEAE